MYYFVAHNVQFIKQIFICCKQKSWLLKISVYDSLSQCGSLKNLGTQNPFFVVFRKTLLLSSGKHGVQEKEDFLIYFLSYSKMP